MSHSPHTRMSSSQYAQYAVSILAALLIYSGIESMIGAASAPLETATAWLINAVLARGWPNVLRLSETSYPMIFIAHKAVVGLVFGSIGLWLGMGLTRRRAVAGTHPQ